jgi:L-iditol 2-dehydrogenase
VSALPTTMRVARLHAWGDVRVEEQPLPAPPGAGEILVRIEACGVCGSDALDWYVATKAPAVLGHEPVGTVVRTGDGVTAVRAGERVFVHHHAPCGACPECKRGLWSSCATWRATRLEPGGFAEYARVPAPNVARDTLALPDTLDWETGTFIEPVACCIRAVRRRGGLEPDDAVLVVGLGAMGLVMTQLARVFGAATVLGSDFLADRRARARALGADAAFDPAAGDVGADVRDYTGGRGADVVIVCPGSTAAIGAGIAAAAPGARVVCFTPLPPGPTLTVDQSALYFREVVLTQSYSCGPDETRAALALLADRRIDVHSLVTHRAGLDGVAAALERAHSGSDGIKTIIFPGADRPGSWGQD